MNPVPLKHKKDPDPLNLLDELAAMRALTEDWIARYDEREAMLAAWYADREQSPPASLLDMADGVRLLERIAAMVKRIEDVRAQNAVSEPELVRIFGQMWRAVELIVPDQEQRRRIADAWLAVRR